VCVCQKKQILFSFFLWRLNCGISSTRYDASQFNRNFSFKTDTFATCNNFFSLNTFSFRCTTDTMNVVRISGSRDFVCFFSLDVYFYIYIYFFLLGLFNKG